MQLKNKKVVVIGLARSGIAAAFFLKSKGAEVTVLDKRMPAKSLMNIKKLIRRGIKLKIGGHVKTDFNQAELIVLSPGVPHDLPILKFVKKQKIPIIGEVELASTFINKPLIGITGTNGKTTTARLIEKMLINSSKKVFLGGNIGVPLITCLNKIEHLEIIIAEISSFQLDTVKKFKPTTSILLNIEIDHMDRYENFRDYANSKMRIFSNQSGSDVAIFNALDKITNELIFFQKIKSQKRSFSKKAIKNGAQILSDSILIFNNSELDCKFDLVKSKLIGFHNRENIAAAAIAALAEGGTVRGVQAAINDFENFDHRLENVRCYRGVRFINDSKATNVHATISALRCFDTPIILIVGGRSKNDNFRDLEMLLPKNVKGVIAMGESRDHIKMAFLNSIWENRLFSTKTLEDALNKAIKFAQKGDTILLSPACTSFDQFENYEQRGEEFKDLVRNLK